MRTDQCDRQSAEARLQELRTNQHERLAAELAEERETKHKLSTTIHITTTAKHPIAMHTPW